MLVVNRDNEKHSAVIRHNYHKLRLRCIVKLCIARQCRSLFQLDNVSRSSKTDEKHTICGQLLSRAEQSSEVSAGFLFCL